MTVSYSKLKKAAFFCLLLPSVIFVLGFLKWYIGVPVAIALAVAYVFAVKGDEDGRTLTLSLPWLLLILGAVVLWCFFAGLGNLWAQSQDWSARNAIFRDLIRFEWPVVYQSKNAALVYYIGYWLPAALCGKGVLALGGNIDAAFLFGNLALLLWSVVCVTVVLLLVLLYVNAAKKWQIAVAVATFILFSGVDLLGTLYNCFAKPQWFPLHIEWWTEYQFSSMTTALNWVFNQSVVAWMATICFLFEKRVRNYAFLIVCALSSSPLPAVGLGLYMVGYAICLLWRALREGKGATFWRDVLTVQNVIPCLTLLPIYFLYYKTNLAVNVGHAAGEVASRDWWGIAVLAVLTVALTVSAIILKRKKLPHSQKLFITCLTVLIFTIGVMLLRPDVRIRYFLFLFFEAFVFLLLIFRDHENDPLFYLTWGIAALCPLIHVGTDADFCMRASIPVVFMIMLFCMRYLLDHHDLLRKKGGGLPRVLYLALIVVLLLGVTTPVVEIVRSTRDFFLGQRAFDWTYTMDQIFVGKLEGTDRNFIASNYKEHFFFSHFAK